ncbi:ester cyclase [Hyalangium sp.]|jgi:carboxymethylenebutenolidase|uniref:ester cyclase n=1 Tax=Hyalangium sp. TaxID=2028555 RepID=UPI002D6BFD69|nr:ester cyclase [Hyalangium sp.]HYI01202.1 ester cyclase [Hyalangium sp.]
MSDLDEKGMSDLWDQHLAAEFGAKSSEQALATMGSHPSVNMVSLTLGGIGRDQVEEFYSKHFLTQIPPDMETIPISRTIGQGRIVDEFISRFTHSIQMDWLLPGIPPTGKRVEVPTLIVVTFENGKIASERVYWDQATVLVQVGLLDRSLPALGAEVARQVVSPTQPMNALLQRAPKR